MCPALNPQNKCDLSLTLDSPSIGRALRAQFAFFDWLWHLQWTFFFDPFNGVLPRVHASLDCRFPCLRVWKPIEVWRARLIIAIEKPESIVFQLFHPRPFSSFSCGVNVRVSAITSSPYCHFAM